MAKTSRSLCSLALICALGLACGGSAKSPKAPQPEPLSELGYAHYLRGQIAAFEGEFVKAIAELRKAAKASPAEAMIVVALIDALYESGDSEQAMRSLVEARDTWPRAPQVWARSGALHRGLLEPKQALRSFRKAIVLGAGGHAIHLAYANALLAAGKKSAAAKHFRKLIATEENTAEPHYQLARLLYQRGDHDKARTHLLQVVDLSPYDLRSWALLSATHRMLGQVDLARDALRRPFDRSGGSARVSEGLMIQLLLHERVEDAALVSEILDRDDLSLDARVSLGHLQLRLGRFQAALQSADRLDLLGPKNAAVVELRVRALRGLHRDEEAKAELLTLPVGDPGHALSRAMLAELLAHGGHHSEAEAVLREAAESHPDDADLTLAQAAVAESAGDTPRAREVLQAALAKHPGARRPLYALAELESRSGFVQRAIELIQPVLRAQPRDASALNYLGYSLIEDSTAHARARHLLLRALELSPESGFILDSYGWFLLRTGETHKAAIYLEKAARLNPAEPEMLSHLAELRMEQGKRAEALALLARAANLALKPRVKKQIQDRMRVLRKSP